MAAVLITVNGVAVAFALGAALVTPLVGCFTRRYDAEVLERDVEAAAEYGAARENQQAAAAAGERGLSPGCRGRSEPGLEQEHLRAPPNAGGRLT